MLRAVLGRTSGISPATEAVTSAKAKARPVPGFVDLQVNGFKGIDFSSPDLTEKDFIHACRLLLAEGTTAFLPTVITSPRYVYERNLPLIATVMESDEFQGRLLGIHLEGPFISGQPGAVGAHNPDYVRKPDTSLLDQLHEWSGGAIRLLTLAAELDGADELARLAVSLGITVSIGHTLADEADMERLAQAGATALTHLGNGLPNMLHRHHNPIWAGLANDGLAMMIISDGHHLPSPMMKSLIRAKGVAEVAIVSDASPVAGLPPGHYTTLGCEAILEESGRLHNPQMGCLVGSTATMLQCMNYLASLGFLSMGELVEMGFHNPLRFIGINPGDVRGELQASYEDEAGVFAFR